MNKQNTSPVNQGITASVPQQPQTQTRKADNRLLKVLAITFAVFVFLLTTAPTVDAFDMFGLNVKENEHGGSGNPSNTNNWPEDIQQAIRADQTLAINKMKNSGDACWMIIRSVVGEVDPDETKKSFWKNLFNFIVSLLNKILGKVSDTYNFSGTDIIFGPECGCPPPRFEKDPVTGKPSRVRIFSVTMDIYDYD